MSLWTAERRRRAPIVLGAALALGFAGGAWLAWLDSGAAWYYVLGVVLTAVAAMQIVAPWGQVPPGSAGRFGRRQKVAGEESARGVAEATARVAESVKALERAQQKRAAAAAASQPVPDLMHSLESALAAEREEQHPPAPKLSDRDRELLGLVAGGASTRQVATTLGISEAVADACVRRIGQDIARLRDDLAQLREEAQIVEDDY